MHIQYTIILSDTSIRDSKLVGTASGRTSGVTQPSCEWEIKILFLFSFSLDANNFTAWLLPSDYASPCPGAQI